MSFAGSVPNVFDPSFSQKRPATVSHPPSPLSRASRSVRHFWISAVYASSATATGTAAEVTAATAAAASASRKPVAPLR